MAAINAERPIEQVLTPDELNWFRGNVPHFLEYLKVQQTLIQQVVIRIGGSGPGTEIPNLDELTEDVADISDSVDALTDDISEIDEQLTATDQGVQHAADARSIAEQALILASTPANTSDLLSRVEALEAGASDLQLIAQISELRQRIEALENGSNA